MRFILATHTREIRSSLFLALNAMDHANIVATANSTGELINYCRALRPDIVVIEDLLPGSSLSEVVDEIRGLVEEAQILIVDGADSKAVAAKVPNVWEFTDIDVLVQACSVVGGRG